MKIQGRIVDIISREIFNAELQVEGNKIVSITKTDQEFTNFILPGFIDAHIHIESSMLVPSEFARIAVKHGTVATVSDPHEIANVLGSKGIDFMLDNSKTVEFKFFYGAPSCVPATFYETSGFTIDSQQIEELFKEKNLKFLSEMMNFPGVINEHSEVLNKIEIAKKYNLPIDGHAPRLYGDALKKYAQAGITTDHESANIEEAVEKIKLGIKLLIREGSAAKNFDSLYKILELYPDNVMLCSDDLHPDDLLKGHINILVKKLLKLNFDIFTVLRAATYNPNIHYNLNVGMLQVNDYADFIVVDNLENFNILQTYINGNLCYGAEKMLINTIKPLPLNNFEADYITENDIKVHAETNKINVIECFDGQLTTNKNVFDAKIIDNSVVSDIENDILKLVVINRYAEKAKPSVAFIKNFNLKKGAFATTIAHDSHNIIAVGTSDAEIMNVVNRLIFNKGGIVVSDQENIYDLRLNIAGLMSDENCEEVADKYSKLNKVLRRMGANFNSPIMTLSFMSLLVIPEIKLGDKFLFDVKNFKPMSLFVK